MMMMNYKDLSYHSISHGGNGVMINILWRIEENITVLWYELGTIDLGRR